MSDLKPCPSCAKGDELTNNFSFNGFKYTGCRRCGLIAENPTAWNRRDIEGESKSVTDRLEQEVAELRGLLDSCQEYIKDVPILRVGVKNALNK